MSVPWWRRWACATSGSVPMRSRRRDRSSSSPTTIQFTALEQRDLLAGFTPGNLLINTVGIGTTLDAAATPVAIREYGVDDVNAPTTATLVNTVAAPSANSGNNAGNLTDSGLIASHGALNLSVDAERVSLTGFDAPAGLANVASTDAISNNRVVGTLTADGQLTRDLYADAFSGTGIRAAISSSSTSHWIAGGNGLRYGSAGTSANITTLLTPRSATVVTDVAGNQFLTGVTSGTVFIWTLPRSLPTSTVGAQTLTLPGISNDLAEVVMLDRSPTRGATNLGGLDTIYVTNGQGTAAGSITKYEWTGTAWTQRGVRTFTNGLNGLTARVTPTGAVQFFVTTRVGTGPGDNQLLTRTDTAAFGSDMSSGPYTVLASAGPGFAFRGLAFAPDEAVESPLTLNSTGVVNASGVPVTLIGNVTHANGSSFKNGSLEVTGAASGDTLSISNLPGQITTSGNDVLYNGAIIGTVTGRNDATALRIDFNPRNSPDDVTTAMVCQLVKQIQMTTTSTDSSRNLTFTLRQATNHKSVTDSTSTTVTVGINHAPTLIQLNAAVMSLPEDRSTAASIPLGDLVISDDAYGANQLVLSGSDA
ncbi:MAG TPA: hypothetical protein VFG20_06280, partial [Planctomycetaceae bacterium]|nr:hypothetical protein [Planctomycetaceae bacterium]